MVFVSCNQVADHILMMLLSLYAVLLIKGAHLLSVEVGSAAKLQIHAYCRRLIDHYDAFLIAEAHHFLTVWIMAGAEAVCSLPFHQGNVLGIHRQIDAAAVGEGVLMLAVAFKIERLLIDQESGSLYTNGAHTIRQGVYIRSKSHADIIKVGI